MELAPFPIDFSMQQVHLYLLDGFLYIRTAESSNTLECYHEHHTRCKATIVINDEAAQACLFFNHSHSLPSGEFLKELDEAENYNIVHLSHEVIACRFVSTKLRAPLGCKYCHKPLFDFDTFQRHVRRHEMCYLPHWVAKKSVRPRKVKRLVVVRKPRLPRHIYQCPYCFEQFTSTQEFMHHQQLNPYQCNTCMSCFPMVSAYFGHSHLNPPVRRGPYNKSGPKAKVVHRVESNIEETPLDADSDDADDDSNWFKCKHCSKGYETKVALSKHNAKYPIFCSVCQTCLPSVSEFLKHETIHKRFAKKLTPSNKCTFCGMQLTPSQRNNKTHVCKEPNLDKFHLDTNSANPAYKCTHCALVCQSYKQLITHATYRCKKRKGGQPLAQVALAINKEGQHVEIQKKVWPNERPKKSRPIILSKPTISRNEEGPIDVVEPDPDFKPFANRTPVGKSPNSSTSEGIRKKLYSPLYSCEECGNEFAKKCDWKDCVLSHVIEFKCPMCSIPLESEDELSKHVVESHTCRFCEEQGKGTVKFPRTHFLQIHIKRYHQVLCPHCKKEFTSQQLVYEHVASDHKCKYCKYNYLPSKEELIKHEATHLLSIRGSIRP